MPTPVPPPADSGTQRFRNKRINEHIKAAYSLCNTIAAAIWGAAYILPVIDGVGGPQELDRPLWVGTGLAFGIFGHCLIRMGWRRED